MPPFSFTTFKTWVLSEKVGNKYEFRSITPMTAANKDEPLEFMVNGQQWRRDRALNFYVLLPEDIKRELKAMEVAKAGGMPDPDDALIPHVVSFRRTSYPAGKDLATHFKKAEHFNVSPAVKTFYLDSEVQKNDQGIYQVFKVVKARDTTVEELAVAKRWYDTLQKAKVRIDEDEMDEGSSGSGAASAAPVDGGKETF